MSIRDLVSNRLSLCKLASIEANNESRTGMPIVLCQEQRRVEELAAEKAREACGG